jgi:DNA-binding transcriptional MerR regulator
MKTGTVTGIFNLDAKTVMMWTDRYKEFFSPEATRSAGNTQRDYNESDIIILNSVRQLRYSGVKDWEEIRNKLAGGWRYTVLPEGAATVGETQMTVYAKTVQTASERDNAVAQLEELELELSAKDELIEQLRQENVMTKETLLREMGELRAKLEREIGQLQGELRVYKDLFVPKKSQNGQE